MKNINWSTSFIGIKVIESRLCVEQKVRHRAVAVIVDKKRPNSKKPIYKMKTFITTKPTAYMLKDQNTLVAHPDFLRAVQKKLGEQMKSDIDKQIRDVFSVTNS